MIENITYINGIDLFQNISNYSYIVVGTNVYCTLSQGLQRDIALNYPYVRELNLKLKYGDISRLGEFLECKEPNQPTFILAFIYKGYAYRKNKTEDTLEYGALESVLNKINKHYQGKTIAMPLLGCSRFDGNGSKERVMELIQNCLTDVIVDVYDYEQKSRTEKQKETREKEMKLKTISYDLYYNAVKKRKIEANNRFKKNGFARY